MSEELLSPTYLAVLTLIGSGAKYGYEIDKILEERGYRNWVDIKFSSVYKALTKLESEGLIKGTKKDESSQPSRKTYSLSTKGRKVLRSQVEMCLKNPPHEKSMFDLGMSAISLLSRDVALEVLRTYDEYLSERLKFFKTNITQMKRARQSLSNANEKESVVAVVQALFERPYVRVKCERKWLRRIIAEIEEDTPGYGFKK